MNSQIEKLIDKGQRSFKAGLRLYEDGDYDFAISRIYYSLFYLSEALLLTKDLTFSKHSAVISQFYKHFVETGIFKKSFHKLLHETFEARQAGDYLSELEFTKDYLQDIIQRVEKFITRVEEYLRKSPF